MKYVPKIVSRLAHKSLFRAKKHSPTLLVVGGVAGMGVAAVLAVKSSGKGHEVVADHHDDRALLADNATSGDLVSLYASTGAELVKVYAPALVVGTISAGAILYGHNILRGRHLAALAAYSGLAEQFTAYRERVATTVGEAMEKEIHNGAHGEYVEDPDRKGEYKLKAVYNTEGGQQNDYLRPWFDERNPRWLRDSTANADLLKGVQRHMNDTLAIRGHLFLNEVYDALAMPRTSEGAVIGWLYESMLGDGYVDFGIFTNDDPHTVAFRNGAERSVRLNFNVDGLIWDQI